MVEDDRRQAVEYLEQIAERMRRLGISVDCATPEGPPAQAILDYARRSETDLIALTTHGRSRLGRFVFGSVADEVLRKSPGPVLLVRAMKDSK